MTNRKVASIPPSSEGLDPDVIAFCALLARIMNRCLQEQDPRIMALIEIPVATPREENEVQYAA